MSTIDLQAADDRADSQGVQDRATGSPGESDGSAWKNKLAQTEGSHITDRGLLVALFNLLSELSEKLTGERVFVFSNDVDSGEIPRILVDPGSVQFIAEQEVVEPLCPPQSGPSIEQKPHR